MARGNKILDQKKKKKWQGGELMLGEKLKLWVKNEL
jgi:hypothetical protein